MHTPPTDNYCGLTLLLSKPSRFDEKVLLSGQPGQWIEDECLLNGNKLTNLDIRDINCTAPLLLNTRRVALCGMNDIPLGYPTIYKSTSAICLPFPQDCCDHKQIEGDDDIDESAQLSDRDTKDDYPTRRYNYRFWFKWHLLKLQKQPRIELRIAPVLYPSEALLLWVFRNIANENLYLDIETSRQHRCITCIGLSSDSLFPRVFVIPVYMHDGNLAYRSFIPLYRLIATLLHRNTIVIHNSMFDLTVLHAFYKFPLPSRVYDTMLANHRIFPEAEKSLAHLIAQWTWQTYHKDISTEVFNDQQQERMWHYNAKDVYNLVLIKKAQEDFCNNIGIWQNDEHFHPVSRRGLKESIAQANDSVLTFLENSITGLRLDRFEQAKTEKKLEQQKKQLERITRILIGDHVFNPASSKQCVDFFHKKLGYPVVKRSEKTKEPSLGRKQLYQLLLKHENPVLPVIIKYREVAKDLSMLESALWSEISL